MEDVKINVTTSAINFWNAFEIYYKHPNAINKQVLFQEHVLSINLESSLNESECRLFYEEFYTKLSKGSLDAENISKNVLKPESRNEIFKNETGMYFLIRTLIPKLYRDDRVKFYEFIFLDKNYTTVYIFTGSTVSSDDLNKPDMQDQFVILKFDFIQLIWNSDNIKLVYNKSLGEKGINWVKTTFVRKFKKLIDGSSNETIRKNISKLAFKSQVDVVEYYKLYEELKQKYAKTIIKNWTETTDPKKFVYEDIGIAAYLILLWSGENTTKKRKNFIDLGCGNGLLVHILNSEGHNGIGLDIRRRKIWDSYPPTTVLKEEAVIPTTDTCYPEADWLIGNHSDELTAWIPIMARRSNHFCQYFVLPCCPYQLNGKKFQRKNSGCSSYQDFIHYVKEISELCQFATKVDKLRIPSTKRICLVGFNNSEVTEQYALISKRILNFVLKECHNCTDKNSQTLDFTPREAVEAVRNCTKVSYTIREEILKIVMNNLLKEKVLHNTMRGEKTYLWNRGGKISIGDLAASIDEELLKQLKSECKGLQTLLKNHHFLFEVSQGCVQFRSPESMLQICKKVLDGHDECKWKKKSCWLFSNHPNGCPLGDEVCSYNH